MVGRMAIDWDIQVEPLTHLSDNGSAIPTIGGSCQHIFPVTLHPSCAVGTRWVRRQYSCVCLNSLGERTYRGVASKRQEVLDREQAPARAAQDPRVTIGDVVGRSWEAIPCEEPAR